MNLLPLPIILFVCSPASERRRLHESFSRFGRELMLLPRRSDVRRMFLLLILPCASFALTNTLGGLGADYRASEKLIAAIAGIGVTLAGIFGSLTVPVLSRRAPLLWLYLGIGVVGGLSTLSLLFLPHSPMIFTFAFVAQNIWQSAALATGNALILSSLAGIIRSRRRNLQCSTRRCARRSVTCNGSTAMPMACAALRAFI